MKAKFGWFSLFSSPDGHCIRIGQEQTIPWDGPLMASLVARRL